MARVGLAIGAVALVAIGGYAARPDTGPQYLGDMPSIIEQADAAAPPPRAFAPPPPAPPPAHVDGPDPVALASPPPVPSVPGERVPAPITDAVRDVNPNASSNGTTGPKPLLDPSGVLPTDLCIGSDTIFKPGQGTFDCVTGQLLAIDPALCAVAPPVPLPVGCLPD